jgi:hypothetical protein
MPSILIVPKTRKNVHKWISPKSSKPHGKNSGYPKAKRQNIGASQSKRSNLGNKASDLHAASPWPSSNASSQARSSEPGQAPQSLQEQGARKPAKPALSQGSNRDESVLGVDWLTAQDAIPAATGLLLLLTDSLRLALKEDSVCGLYSDGIHSLVNLVVNSLEGCGAIAGLEGGAK